MTRMPLPPLRMIAAFEAVARLGNRAAAAAELNVTTGAITKQLRALEQWLGVRLFEGEWRAITPMTPAGRRLAVAVTAGMETIQNGIGEIMVTHLPARELRVLVPASLSVNWLLPLLPQLERDTPGLRLRVQPTHTGDDWLAMPHDAAIRRDGFVPEGYGRELLFQERLTAYVAPSLLAEGFRERALEAAPMVESRTRLGDLDRWLAAAGVGRIGVKRQEFAHFYTAYEAAIAGGGLVVAPTILAAADVAAGRLVAVDAAVTIAGAQHALLTRAHAGEIDHHVAVLAAWLRRQV
ncbi:LysR family transcriptional regulator [Rhodovastum atsumiense]|uniref:LysR family transcriptional regulator n=1 Tax=Rhodovastum atsumiense TaxID=504468 RepID=A0A5M6IQ42_9PROT|nr:LysR substrate-binding domain-containing protein [Rhodovastum atsumiense]KAA5610393.1 LysR family transcriptional regulator [Rhodovastum atsumiense]CAH2602928.1 LysR family transcriptional regulator [Rhodovastum atsumiense]